MRGEYFGTVKWFNDARGFGFIVPDNEGDMDVFAHFKSIESDMVFKSLVEGQRVRYEYSYRDDGRAYSTKVWPL